MMWTVDPLRRRRPAAARLRPPAGRARRRGGRGRPRAAPRGVAARCAPALGWVWGEGSGAARGRGVVGSRPCPQARPRARASRLVVRRLGAIWSRGAPSTRLRGRGARENCREGHLGEARARRATRAGRAPRAHLSAGAAAAPSGDRSVWPRRSPGRLHDDLCDLEALLRSLFWSPQVFRRSLRV